MHLGYIIQQKPSLATAGTPEPAFCLRMYGASGLESVCRIVLLVEMESVEFGSTRFSCAPLLRGGARGLLVTVASHVGSDLIRVLAEFDEVPMVCENLHGATSTSRQSRVLVYVFMLEQLES